MLNYTDWVVYIRKVKKSESKSQLPVISQAMDSVVYIRKVKKSESKSQPGKVVDAVEESCVYP